MEWILIFINFIRQDLQDIQDIFCFLSFRPPAPLPARRGIQPEGGAYAPEGRKLGNSIRLSAENTTNMITFYSLLFDTQYIQINPACPVAPADLSAFGGWHWGLSCLILKNKNRIHSDQLN